MKTCIKCKIEKKLVHFYRRFDRNQIAYRTICKSCISEYMKVNSERNKNHKRNFRLEVLAHYSKSKIPFCNCCGEKTIQFLCIDHINGGGNEHRRQIGNNVQLAYWLKRNNYPSEFQVLCHNCNMAKGFYGQCPHTIILSKV